MSILTTTGAEPLRSAYLKQFAALQALTKPINRCFQQFHQDKTAETISNYQNRLAKIASSDERGQCVSLCCPIIYIMLTV